MLAFEDVDVIGSLIAGDWKTAKSACSASDSEPAVVDTQLKEVIRSLVYVLYAELRRVDSVRVCSAIIGTPADCEVERIHRCRTKRVGVGKNESLCMLHVAGY